MSSARRSRRRRAERTQVLVGDGPTIAGFAASWRCPDCDSEFAGFWTDDEGLTHARIEHDDGCPWLSGETR